MSGQLTTAEVMQSAPGNAAMVEARSITMKMFRSKTNVATCVRDQVMVPMGQIVGMVVDVVEKDGTLPDGQKKTSLICRGSFEAMAYESGEVVRSFAAYLPSYFAEALQTNLKAMRDGQIMLGLEIVIIPTGLDPTTNLPKSPAYSWGVKNLVSTIANDPIDQIKRKLGAKGMLRLPTPPVAEVEAAVVLPSAGLDKEAASEEAVEPDAPGASDTAETSRKSKTK